MVDDERANLLMSDTLSTAVLQAFKDLGVTVGETPGVVTVGFGWDGILVYVTPEFGGTLPSHLNGLPVTRVDVKEVVPG